MLVRALLLLVLAALGCAAGRPSTSGSAAPPASVATITLLHTNDLHGHLEPWKGWTADLSGREVGGLARIAGHVARIRAETEGAVLLVDAGDTFFDTMLAHETRGAAVVAAMNTVGYDAMTLGNHEVDLGPDVLRARIREARFPVLAANLFDARGNRFTAATSLHEVGGMRVGIVGLAYPWTPETTDPANVAGLRFEQPVTAARRAVADLRARGAQLVVALTHLGLGADRALARTVEGIDVIVGGHSHHRPRTAEKVGATLVVQAGAHGSDLGRLDLTVAADRITQARWALIPMIDGAPDPVTEATIARARAPLAGDLDTEIGTAGTWLPRAETLRPPDDRHREDRSPVDALFAEVLRRSAEADVAFLPGVGYGVAIEPGVVTRAELRNLVPHPSKVVAMDLKGRAIRAVLEQALENVFGAAAEERVGGMIQVAGLRFAYDARRPRGARLLSAHVRGEPLDDHRVYRAVVSGLLAEGGHRQETFTTGTNVRELGLEHELLEHWWRSRGSEPVRAVDQSSTER